MDITVIGTGYVGLVYGACLADIGHKVTCIDSNEAKIGQLQKGQIPIFEPGLNEIVDVCSKNGRLTFSSLTNVNEINSEVIMIAVGTPESADGSADISGVISAAETIANKITKNTVIVIKSTVPVGTASIIKDVISKILSARMLRDVHYSVVSNPEFLKEGSAISDFRNPDRIVIGSDDRFGTDVLSSVYKQFLSNGVPLISTDTKSAELLKYAANAMLATRISFMNEIANFAEVVGADIDSIKQGLSTDPRIGSKFLNPGIGFGGSCFPKDVRALISMSDINGYSGMEVIKAVDRVNTSQKMILVEKANSILGNLKDKQIGIWGLSFKPNTDDIREAPSLKIIKELLNRGAEVQVFDPIVDHKSLDIKPLRFAQSALEAAKGVDALLILTEWPEFTEVDLEELLKIMPSKTIIDGRNIFTLKQMEQTGFHYYSIGRSAVNLVPVL